MKYAFVTMAVLAIWLGTILLACFNVEIGVFLPCFAIFMTAVIFIIGFCKKK